MVINKHSLISYVSIYNKGIEKVDSLNDIVTLMYSNDRQLHNYTSQGTVQYLSLTHTTRPHSKPGLLECLAE